MEGDEDKEEKLEEEDDEEDEERGIMKRMKMSRLQADRRERHTIWKVVE